MTEFEADLKRAFAAQEYPADAGFTAAVTGRVARRGQALSLQKWLNLAAFVVAGGAFAYGVVGAFAALGPSLAAEFGLGVAAAHGALSGGFDLSGLGAALTPLLIAAAAGIGGLAVARAAAE